RPLPLLAGLLTIPRHFLHTARPHKGQRQHVNADKRPTFRTAGSLRSQAIEGNSVAEPIEGQQVVAACFACSLPPSPLPWRAASPAPPPQAALLVHPAHRLPSPPPRSTRPPRTARTTTIR